MKLTLCGSLRFEPYWHEANKQLGLAGHICYSVMTFPSIEGDKTWYTPSQKWTLDLAHLAKIEESDGVVMLNIDGYLGESSLRELEWARMRQKKVFWTITKHPKFLPTDWWARELAGFSLTFSCDWIELIEAVKRRQGNKAFQEIHDRM
jgi:hypothetical protein